MQPYLEISHSKTYHKKSMANNNPMTHIFNHYQVYPRSMTFPVNPGMYPQQIIQPNDSNYSEKINDSRQFGDSVTDNPSFSPIRTPPLSLTQGAPYINFNPTTHYNDPPVC